MANNLMKNQSRSSDRGGRGGYQIPPLPQSKVSVDKENRGRSPLGLSSSSNSRGLGFSSSISLSNKNKSKQQSSSLAFSLKRNNDPNLDPQNRNRGVLVPLPFAKNGTRTGEDALHMSGGADKQKSPSFPKPSSSNSRIEPTNNPSTRRRVLRYRESIESLFSITSESSEEYHQLCRDIVDGHLADDAASWCHVLDLASEQEKNSRSKTRGSGRDLIRLHRRATSRFSLEKFRNDQSHVFQIWLSYAELLSKTGATEDCRLIFDQLREHGCGTKKASFYLALAEFERHHDAQKAKEALQSGISQKAQPTQALRKALNRIGLSSDSVASRPSRIDTVASSSRTKAATGTMTSAKPKSKLPKLPTSLSPRKRKADQKDSPKRQRTESGAVEVTIPAKTANNTDKGKESDMSLAGDAISLTSSDASERADSNEKTENGNQKHASRDSSSSMEFVLSQESDDTIGSLSHFKAAFESETNPKLNIRSTPTVSEKLEQSDKETTNNKLAGPKRRQQISPSIGTRSGKPVIGHLLSSKNPTKAAAIDREGGSALKRPPRQLSKTPRLARARLSGKAQRVGFEHSMADDSDSDSDDSVTKNVLTRSTVGETQSVSKVTKSNLGYMFAWNPDKKRESSTGNGSETRAPTPTIEQTHDLLPLKSSLQTANPQSSQLSLSLTRKSMQSTDSERSEKSDHSTPSSHASGRRLSERSTQKPSTTAVSPATAKLIENSNPDFLPLVSESNILKVNNVPYVKLGVVGKGGSSKVYRALTKDCTVLAIKKVKLSGMDRKAIDSYANEIALLKRLRNNPAIIQMYDSEVDLARKAIFVVMEAGEVDLSQVLQQQSMLSDNGKRALNMNFIRLTWSQMMSAVHCIHEERIIHGDLKPANFLFVRGALKLIDFGIAKAIQSDDTTNIYRENHIGTVNYMSPEAFLDTGGGKPGSQKMKCGRASDIWSLGCILYQMTYGRPPFASLHMIQKMQAIVNPNHKISFPNTVDEGAIDAMQQCLNRRAEDRPPIVGKNGLLNEHRFLNSSRSS